MPTSASGTRAPSSNQRTRLDHRHCRRPRPLAARSCRVRHVHEPSHRAQRLVHILHERAHDAVPLHSTAPGSRHPSDAGGMHRISSDANRLRSRPVSSQLQRHQVQVGPPGGPHPLLGTFLLCPLEYAHDYATDHIEDWPDCMRKFRDAERTIRLVFVPFIPPLTPLHRLQGSYCSALALC